MRRAVKFLISACCLILVGCAKGSDGSGVTALSHPIVGSWDGGTWDYVFNADRTATEAHTHTGCKLTGSFTFDISGTTLTSVYTGQTKSDETGCETYCQANFGMTCAASSGQEYYLHAHTSAAAAVSGSTLTIDGTFNFTKN
jgi:hypothetical protein